jgi:hypothetical protein
MAVGRYAKNRMFIWVEKAKLVCLRIVIEEKLIRHILN